MRKPKEKFLLAMFLASTFIVLSAAYTIYMLNRIVFGGSFSLFLLKGMIDFTKREYFILFI